MIGVVGGGIAGLAAAYRLQSQGYAVSVYEAAPSLGGLAHCCETGGDSIEQYYHQISKSETTDLLVELCSELGLDDKLEWHIGKQAFYVDSEIHDFNTPVDLLRYPALSLSDKIRLGLFNLGIDLSTPIPSTHGSLSEFEDIPVKEFLIE